MKTITNLALACCAASSLLLSSCIEETEPMGSTVIEKQIGYNLKDAALSAALAMPSNMVTSRGQYFTFSYPSMMIMRDAMTADLTTNEDADYFRNYSSNLNLGETSAYTQVIWDYYYKQLQAINETIAPINSEQASEGELGIRAAAKAYRAMAYLDLARWVEFLPNDKTSPITSMGNDVTHLTVPIVTESTTAVTATKNPRATRQEMFDFILADLDEAEQNIGKLEQVPQLWALATMPRLSAVYGLKARLYMWVEDYAKAREFARKAINAGLHQPMTKAEYQDKRTGFNSSNNKSWMWSMSINKETNVVGTVANFTSWRSPEATFGFAGHPSLNYSTAPRIGKALYDRMSNTDLRKALFVAPTGSVLAAESQALKIDPAQPLPTYVGFKFRPGSGETVVRETASVISLPIMRMEEMVMIEAEAAAHLNPIEGRDLLVAFMKSYRDPNYSTTATTKDEVVEEIVFQKRVERWGEGQSLFDIKRLNYSVTRRYEGSNFPLSRQFNTDGRPAWMNLCIVDLEKRFNRPLTGYENPDPSGLYPTR